mmetsp:Transcript_7385/g.16932  ORF Transcript_7385/g.16932 Transcript_7385/m.16932 type:complete len:432 (-) Transcript_7385:3-1298(-)
MPDTWFAAVEGVRGMVHLSLMGLHASMMTTAHLPSEGGLWKLFRKHPVYTVMQCGGTQVDICFLLSGFLLTYRLLSAGSQPSTASFAFKRALRMLPAMIFVTAVGCLMGDNWDAGYNEGQPRSWRIASYLLFIGNYLDVSKWGSFTLSLSWSNAVDFQCSLILFGLIGVLQSRIKDRVALAKTLRDVLLVLFFASMVICGVLFKADSLNIFLLGQYSHYGLLQTDSSYRWLADTYNHHWKTTNSASELSHSFMNGLYLPTHTRFGPYAAGGILACNVYLANSANKSQGTTLGSIVRVVFTLLACAQLIAPCIPPDDAAPIEAQLFATAALRQLSAAAMGMLLYRALVPPDHTWSSSWARALFTFPAFAPIGKVSYVSYLVHFRLFEFLNFTKALYPPANAVVSLWVWYMLRLFFLGAAGSLWVLAAFLNLF